VTAVAIIPALVPGQPTISRRYHCAMAWQRLVAGRSLGATLIRALVIALALLLTSQYVISPVRAYGISMKPTLEPGAWLWLSRLAYLRRPPARGDIVAVNLLGGEAVLVKRVVGLPGERIAITDGEVLVNGVPLAEPYVSARLAWNVREVQLDPHEYYVIGDNRGMPAHLHDFGRAARSRIAGRVLH
jgi:signal peptidase I